VYRRAAATTLWKYLLAGLLPLLSRETALAQPSQAKPAARLANFDKRQPQPSAPPRRPASLRANTRGLRVELDAITGSPRSIRSAGGFLMPERQLRAADSTNAGAELQRTVREFIQDNENIFNHGPDLLDSAEIKREHITPHNGMRTISWQQKFEGIPVFSGTFTAHGTKNGALINISSLFLRDVQAAAAEGTPDYLAQIRAPKISFAEAVRRAAENLGSKLPEQEIKPSPGYEGKHLEKLVVRGLKGETRGRLVWLPLSPSAARLCWQIELTVARASYRILVDAIQGDILLRRSLTYDLTNATYRVFTGDSPSPLSPGHGEPGKFQPGTGERRLVATSALSTNASPAGWLEEGANETLGNNVDAHTDWNDDDFPDLPRPRGTPRRIFDFPQDLAQSPRTYPSASVVQLFYWINWMHDKLYDLGFTESAGNFQNRNFGRGGEEGDPILADAQDGGGFNNANFTVSDDGVPGRIQMYIFDGPEPDRDGSLDAEIVLHEYTHGLTTRLVGGGDALYELQSAGLGEGWSDFFAIALLGDSLDQTDGIYAPGAYASYQLDGLEENYYFGIRRYPYTTDLTKNPLTFKDIDPTAAAAHEGIPRSPIHAEPFPEEVHAQGEVWCVTLWEARARLIQKYGFEVGNRTILQLLVDALKLTPPEPTFLEARDAILEADLVNHGGANRELLWGAFAKRGLGFSAVAPPSSTTLGVIEAFDIPDDLLVRPIVELVASGAEAGPFIGSETVYTLRNVSTNEVRWSVFSAAPWITFSAISGSIPPGGSPVELKVSVNSLADNLPPGIYTDAIAISNHVTRRVQSRAATLRVGQPDLFTQEISSPGEMELFRSSTITFTPDGSKDYYRACRESAAAFPVDPALGTHLELDDDDFKEVQLRDGALVSFYGQAYSNLFVGANGYITLGNGASDFRPTLASHFDLPRISGFFTDLDPSSGGMISWTQLPDRVVVTYQGVPLFLSFRQCDFQIEIFFDGRVRVTWLDLSGDTAIVGLSPGKGAPRHFSGTRFADLGSCLPPLAIELPSEANEATGAIPGTIRLPAVSATNVVLTVHSQHEKTAFSTNIVVPAGQTNASFTFNLRQSTALEGTVIIRVTVEAPGFLPSSARVALHDAQRASLSLTIPARAREGAGLLAEPGSLEVHGTLTQPVLVRLSSTPADKLVVPEVVVVTPSSPLATFPIEVRNDNVIDGPREVILTATVENWDLATAKILVEDDEQQELSLELPAYIGEGTGVARGIGRVGASGILQNALTVRLEAGPSLLSLPPSIVIPAGSSNINFDLESRDDSIASGSLAIQVRAVADGFVAANDVITLYDDESAATPAAPSPRHLSDTNSPDSDLAWAAPSGQIVLNGDFETGVLDLWNTESTGNGGFFINDGTLDPEGPGGQVQPFGGRFSVVSRQGVPGRQSLYQQVVIPAGTISATLRWRDRIENHSARFGDPGQNFRVEIRGAAGEVLSTPFRTKPGDPLISDWTQREVDLTPFQGNPIQLRFIQENVVGYFNVHLDDITLDVRSGPVTNYRVYFGASANLTESDLLGSVTTNHWALPRLGLDQTYYWRVVAQNGVSSSESPVWQFRVPAAGLVDHFTWQDLPGVIFSGEPTPVSIQARDLFGNVASSFDGLAHLRARIQVPDRSVGHGRALSEFPLGGFYPVTRMQAIYRNFEIGPARRLTALALDVASIPTVELTRFTIRIKPTQLATFRSSSASWDRTGWTTVVQKDLRVDEPGWAVIPFSTPFDYDGTNNLLIDLSFKSSTFGASGETRATSHDQARAIAASTFSGDPLTWSGTSPRPDLLTNLPNLRLVSEVPLTLSPTVSGRFTNGLWRGNLTLHASAQSSQLLADDLRGHVGAALPFSAFYRNDLALLHSSPESVSLGGALSYRFTIHNAGSEIATGVILSNRIEANAIFSSAETTHGSFEANESLAVFRLGTLAPGTAAEVRVTVTPTAIGTVTNVASLFRLEPDPVASNNVVISSTRVDPQPHLRPETVTSVEAGAISNYSTFRVFLSTPGSVPVSVEYATAPRTASSADFEEQSGTLTFPPGVTETNISIRILDDAEDEADEVFALQFNNPINATLATGEVLGTIIDDEGPAVRVEDATVLEGNGIGATSLVFRILLSTSSVQTVTVSYLTTPGTAAEDIDFTPVDGEVSFAPGTVERRIFVNVRKDAEIEPDERFVFNLTSADGGEIVRATAYGTILNDDGLAGDLHHFDFVSLSSPQAVNVPFPLTVAARDRFGGPAPNFNGVLSLSALTAAAPVTIGSQEETSAYPLDTLYNDLRLQVIYPAAEMGPAREITGLGLYVLKTPSLPLNRWTIRMKHTSLARYPTPPRWESTGWTTVYQATERLTQTGLVTFTFSRPFAYDGVRNVLIDFSFNNSDFDFDGGEVLASESQVNRVILGQSDDLDGDPLTWSGQIPFPSSEDLVPNLLLLSGTAVALSTNQLGPFVDGLWTGELAVQSPVSGVQLKVADAQNHTGVSSPLDILVRDDLALSISDSPDPVTIGQVFTYTLSVTNTGPAISHALVLSNPVPAGVTVLTSTAGGGTITVAADHILWQIAELPGGTNLLATVTARAPAAAGVLNHTATVIRSEPESYILNNSVSERTRILEEPVLTLSDAIASEADATISFSVVMSVPSSEAVRVVYIAHSDTAIRGSDFLYTEGELTFPPGSTNQTISVPLRQDSEDEPAETLKVGLASIVGGWIRMGGGVGTIIDDDGPTIHMRDESAMEGDLGSTALDFTVLLDRPSIQPVSVKYATIDGAARAGVDFTRTSGTLLFPPGTMTQRVTVSILSDLLMEPSETFALVLSNAENASLSADRVTGTILNDDGQAGDLHSFVFDQVPSPVFSEQNQFVTILARDGFLNRAVKFSGTATVQAEQTVPPILIGTGATDWEYPLGTFSSSKLQTIYNAGEIGSALELDALSLTTTDFIFFPESMANVTIRLRHTPLNSFPLGAAWESNSWVNVFAGQAPVVTDDGLITFPFATRFPYNGSNNLMVEFSVRGGDIFSFPPYCLSTRTNIYRSLAAQSGSAAHPTNWTGRIPLPQRFQQLPNIQFSGSMPIAILGSGTKTFQAGLWQGYVQLRGEAPSVRLRISDPLGHAGISDSFALATLLDTDMDGLPDAWERSMALDPRDATDAALDSDQDGLSNVDEFLSGSAGNEPRDALRFVSAERISGNLVLRALVVPGFSYAVERSQGLEPAAWTEFARVEKTESDLLEITDPAPAASPACFYRIRTLR
jgi:uncharacterized repeat protein (TIGR01451 family)